MIELPHSPLIKYTATDLEDNSAAFGEAVAYKKLDYKVCSMTLAPFHPSALVGSACKSRQSIVQTSAAARFSHLYDL